MSERIEMDIREALELEANAVEIPEDLAHRTIEAARAEGKPGLRLRWRSWRDARTVGGRVTGYPRWAYAGASAVAMVLLFVVGSVVLPGPDSTVTGPTFLDGSAPTDLRTEEFADQVLESQAQRGAAVTSGGQPGEAADLDEHEFAETVPESAEAGAFPPRLIQQTEIEVEVARGGFDRAWRQARDVAARHGGQVISLHTEMQRDRLARGTLVVRVPQERLDTVLGDLGALGTVARQGSSGQDASAQFVDLDARIRSAEAQEVRLLELLDQARNVSEILEIRTRLDDTREEIEQLRGQRELLQSQVDFATVQATIFEPNPTSGGDGRFEEAWRMAWNGALTIFAGFVVVAGFVIPFALIGFALWLVVGLFRRRASS